MPASSETWDAWYARYHAHQRSLGEYGSGISPWREWISPRIGHLRVDRLTVRHVEAIRDALDEGIQAWIAQGGARRKGTGAISGLTAMSVWHTLRSSIKAARRSKVADLRVLVGRPDPCDDVEPPGDARSRRGRRKTFIYPAEARTLLECTNVPIDWRELYAIAGYTYLRPGELLVLRWDTDVDLDRWVVRVSRAWHFLDRKPKVPKTREGVRELPIEKHLRPLLVRMRRHATSELVVPVMQTRVHNTLPWRLRGHLWTAGVRRPALHETTLTAVRANFRSWRDSGITWLAMAEVHPTKIMRRAGHTGYDTTMGYIRQAEDLTGQMGKPFGPLPRELINGGNDRRKRKR